MALTATKLLFVCFALAATLVASVHAQDHDFTFGASANVDEDVNLSDAPDMLQRVIQQVRTYNLGELMEKSWSQRGTLTVGVDDEDKEALKPFSGVWHGRAELAQFLRATVVNSLKHTIDKITLTEVNGDANTATGLLIITGFRSENQEPFELKLYNKCEMEYKQVSNWTLSLKPFE
eukprot:GFYU01001798.1.p2 GENE.GFYU01001798.1~~GFYU01001798.1.p2  ORF type:complete len:177 (-),score=68.87 GFYU01001798.1:19-549(-)